MNNDDDVLPGVRAVAGPTGGATPKAAGRSTSLLKRLALFTALGAALLAVQALMKDDAVTRETVQINRTQLEAAEAAWRARWGREPSEQEMAAILRTEADEEVLFREAVKAGLHRSDPVVRRRLWQNTKFLELDQPAESGAALLERAYALDMHISDIVVRRRLVQRFHGTLLESARPPEPTREALEAFIAANRAVFETVPRVSFAQIYLDDDVDTAASRAQALLAQLRRDGGGPDAAGPLGDPLALERHFDGMTLVDVAKRFGSGFTEALNTAPLGEWSGPYTSPFGLHLVWIEARQPAQVVLDEGTLAKARELLIDKQKAAMVRQAIAALREHYEITVGDTQTAASAAAGADERKG